MELSNLHVSKNYGGPGYNCTIHFKGENGAIELKLPPETSEKILAVIADQLVFATKDIATKLTREVIDASTLQIESDDA